MGSTFRRRLDGAFMGQGPLDSNWVHRLDYGGKGKGGVGGRGASFFFLLVFRSGVTNTPRGGVVHCARVKFLGVPFRSQRALSAHPSPLEIGVLSSSLSVAPLTSVNAHSA